VKSFKCGKCAGVRTTSHKHGLEAFAVFGSSDSVGFTQHNEAALLEARTKT
jgi:hypothetical protein